MTAPSHLTLPYVVSLLFEQRLISPEQREMILEGAKAQEARLIAVPHQSGRRVHRAGEAPSPAQIVSSFNLETHGDRGRILSEDAITEALAKYLRLPYLKIDPLKLDLDIVTTHIPRPFALRHLIVPVAMRDGDLVVATADPFDDEPLREFSTAHRMKVRRVLSSCSDIQKVLRDFYGFRASVVAAEAEASAGADLGNLEQFFRMKGNQELAESEGHVISAVDFLLSYAFDQRASDIHIEPKREKCLIRFRLDGLLHTIHLLPKPLHAPIVSRIKLLARMDLAEKRRPQDGRIKTSHNGKDVELRISTVPTAFGEKVVIRIFDPDILLQALDTIGFYAREYRLYTSFIQRPNGIILVTGPTGSGKTTTLYSSLRTLSSPEINIVTIEDPIEMVMEEFNQIAVQPAIGVTFATILRTVLRQDPDIVMVGEIRDRETAENAVQAALTGHLVLSTLHTNDAPSSIARLIDLGIPPYLISATVAGIVAQRLLRKVCPHCAVSRTLTPEEQQYLQLAGTSLTVREGSGCRECRGTGYKGRTGVFEVLELSERIRPLVTEPLDLAAVVAAAVQDGYATLRQIAIRKMLEGITTYDEVVSITG
ncbi:GspE/PulE family protein [Trichlorobacter ammonificans]|uniref:Type II secretory pathway, ATPase PulE/Tfp pilus assembly pathway, ATPase PilB n=1 Tax=Trichlorobacter ammonificans TaxID=2916410 RepID=A0ABN8HKX4_9BACT|nr:type II/IV secretion system protein [Trichlorobacter ammonificans]CAH2030613.1 Type II secretory pathway, ATPase PulE/Tfp pilus assembly pathway, ATPase PilB [Trichlorobacter ammonificans]